MTTFKRVSDAEAAARVQFVVCVPASERTLFHDNVFGTCDACGEAVQHRPDVPKAKLLCVACWRTQVAERGSEDDVILVPERTVREVIRKLTH